MSDNFSPFFSHSKIFEWFWSILPPKSKNVISSTTEVEQMCKHEIRLKRRGGFWSVSHGCSQWVLFLGLQHPWLCDTNKKRITAIKVSWDQLMRYPQVSLKTKKNKCLTLHMTLYSQYETKWTKKTSRPVGCYIWAVFPKEWWITR